MEGDSSKPSQGAAKEKGCNLLSAQETYGEEGSTLSNVIEEEGQDLATQWGAKDEAKASDLHNRVVEDTVVDSDGKRARKGRFGWKHKEFACCQVEFQMKVGHPSGHVGQAVRDK